MQLRVDDSLRKAVAEMPMRIRLAHKEWMNAPEHVRERGVRIEVGVEGTDPLLWLQAQRFTQKVYWSGRDDGVALAGVGCCHACTLGSVEEPADLFRRCREVLDQFGSRKPVYTGGFAFSSPAIEEAPWPEMGRTRFWIPFAELSRREGKSVLACNLYFRRNAEVPLADLLQAWQAVLPVSTYPEPLPTLICRHDFPERAGWEANVRSALDLIQNGVIDKLVLARKAVYTFASPVPADRILAVLKQVTDHCYHFLIQPSERVAFMGTTPERLYRRAGRQLETEALAGTRPRSPEDAADEALGLELMQSPKERHEQELVRRDLIRNLHLLAVSVEAEETPHLLKLERKQHLLSRLSARLRADVMDSDILTALHPTPAVGGSPRPNALRELSRLEPFCRGWYAAPVGIFGGDFAEFAVAIRSGLVQDRQVNIYSGAGIVQGSVPAEEWQEIENKISDFVKVTSGRLR